MGLFDFWRGKKITLADGGFWSSFFGDGQSWSGESVGQKEAMMLSAWYAGTKLISQTVATLPITLYRRDGQGNRKPDFDNPLHELLHDSPNADLTAVEYWEGVVGDLVQNGNSFSEKTMVGRRTRALTPLTDVTVTRNDSGARVFHYNDRGKTYDLPEDKVFFVRGFGKGDLGLSPLAHARQQLGLVIATEKAAARSFAHGMRASGFFTAPPGTRMDQKQREDFKNTFIKPYVGGDATAKVGLLEGGFDFKPVNMTHEDAEMLLSRRFNVEDVCRWLGVPPILIGHAAQGQTMWGTGIEQIMLGWLTLQLRPYLQRIEQAIRKRLIAPEDRATLKAEFSVEALLRADSAGRAAFYSTMVQNGIYSRNRVRALENEPRDPDPMADKLTVQSNLIELGQLGQVAANNSEAQARSAIRDYLMGGLEDQIDARVRMIVEERARLYLESQPRVLQLNGDRR